MKDAMVTMFSRMESCDVVKVFGVVCMTGLSVLVLTSLSGYDLNIDRTSFTFKKHESLQKA